MSDPILNKDAERFIPISAPWLDDNESFAIQDCIANNWISQGPKVAKFEQEFAKTHDNLYGSACNSGTTAIHLALKAIGIEKGDEVIIPDFTMVAVANSVLACEAVPVFADAVAAVEKDGNVLCSLVGNTSLYSIKKCITAKTKAIIVVHTYGEPVEDIQAIADFCKQKNIFLVEDCAESTFARISGKPVGSFGDIATFSFYSNKNITTGEGGMVLTNSAEIKDRLDRIRMHAFTPGMHFNHTERAFGYRMTDLQAAIGLTQLTKASFFMDRRRRYREIYDNRLKDCKKIIIPRTTPESGYWVMPILTNDQVTRDKYREHLANNGIETRTYFFPMSTQVFLKQYERNECHVAKFLGKAGFYLPLYPKLSEEDINYIIDKMIEMENK
jgi:perosamine synthetase